MSRTRHGPGAGTERLLVAGAGPAEAAEDARRTQSKGRRRDRLHTGGISLTGQVHRDLPEQACIGHPRGWSCSYVARATSWFAALGPALAARG